MGAIPDRATLITCKICNSKAKYVFSMHNEHGQPHTLDIFLCSYCGLLYVGNLIRDDQLVYAYGTLDTNKYYHEIAINTENKVFRSLSDLRTLLYNRLDKPSVLDVGCGWGHFLDALSRKYPSVCVVGQELLNGAASVCQAKGFKVLTCSLENISDKFSIIVLLDVAEHLVSPNRTFAICYSLLKRDGHIYIHTPRRCLWDRLFLVLINIPLLGTLSRIWFRTRVNIFHLHLWTDKALKLSLKKAGFQLIYLKSEMEFSWNFNKYSEVYLGKIYHFPPLLVKIVTALAEVFFIWLRTLKNKAICLGQKIE